MNALVQALFWLTLSTWFGAVLFSAIVPPILLRVIREADPTLPRVLSVNLDKQHSTLLAGMVVSELLHTLFRVEAVCAAVLFPTLVAEWFTVDRTMPNVVLPIVVSGLYVIAVVILAYGWRIVWPKVIEHRQKYIDNADNPDVANAELDAFDRYSNELFSVVRNLLFAVMGMILFSASFQPYVLSLTAK
ncbi:MAG: hypothetical protein ACTHM6_14460 [Tepidisphaeraceae bacterium]